MAARQGHKPEKLIHLRASRRPAEGAAGKIRHDRSRAGIGVLSRGMPAHIHEPETFRRRLGGLVKGPPDIDRLVAVIHAGFHAVRLDPRPVLAQGLDVFLRQLAPRRNQRLRRTRGRLGAVILGRQPVIVPQIRCREQVLARRHPRTHFHHLPLQVRSVHDPLVHLLAVDIQSGVHRLRLVRPVTVQHQPETILRVHREPVQEMRRMQRAQSRQVVVEQILG